MPRKARSPEERLNTYPPEMWDTLVAAVARRCYQRQFGSHSQACSFISRFYNFRFDCMDAKWQGAHELRNMYVTGTDATGQRFHTRNKNLIPPITITWQYTGISQELLDQVAGGKPPEPEIELPTRDRGEEAVLAWLREPRVPKQHDTEGHELPMLEEEHRDQPEHPRFREAASEPQGEGSTTVGTKGECSTGGSHEWDVSLTHCLKCHEPHPEVTK